MWREGARLAPAVAAARWRATSPYKLLLSVTDRCTLRCRACHAWVRAPRPELSPAEIDRLLAGLPGLRWLDLTGGEPTARTDILEVADAVARHAPRLIFLHLATNGFEPARAEAVVRRLVRGGGPAPVITVSLDGDQALHDRLRGAPGAFGRAVETARRLNALPDVRVYVGTTLTPDNLGALPATARALAAELPALVPARWHVNAMQRSPHFFGNEGAPLPERDALARALDEVRRLRGWPRDAFALAEWTWERLYHRHARTGAPPVPCQALRASVFVDAAGDVYPCHLRDTLLGNVRAHDLRLADVLRSAPALAEARAIGAEPCARCWTPCEAYHAILAHPARAVARAVFERALSARVPGRSPRT